MSHRPFTCSCQSCGASDRPLVFHGFFSAAICPVCAANPPAEFADRCAKAWYGDRGRMTAVRWQIKAKLRVPKFSAMVYAQ